MAITPDIAANTAHMCGIVILTSSRLQAKAEIYFADKESINLYNCFDGILNGEMMKSFNMPGKLCKCSRYLLGWVFVKPNQNKSFNM